MDLSGPEMRQVLLMGGVGLAFGSLYQLAATFLKQSCDEVALDPETEALQLNSELLTLFVQLAEFRSFQESAWREAVVSADELMVRAKAVSDKKIHVNTDDVTFAMARFKNTERQIARMQRAAQDAQNPRAAAKIYQLLTKIYPILQSTYGGVQRALFNAR